MYSNRFHFGNHSLTTHGDKDDDDDASTQIQIEIKEFKMKGEQSVCVSLKMMESGSELIEN